MPKVVKEIMSDLSTGELSVEWDDDSTNKFNLANTLTVLENTESTKLDFVFNGVAVISVGTTPPVDNDEKPNGSIYFQI